MFSIDLISAIHHDKKEYVLKAVTQGADINAAKGTGLPLQTAAQLSDVAILELLLTFGAEVNALDGKGRTALHYAAENSVVCVKILLKYQANPNISDCDGCTPLHWAACKGKPECVTSLLQSGADVNVQNIFGETPLFWAARRTCLDVVKILLNYNADPCLANKKDELPLSKTLLAFYLGFETDDDITILDLLTESTSFLHYKYDERERLKELLQSHQHLKLYRYLQAGVLPLKQICRYVIRSACRQGYLPSKINKLPISATLKQYLTISDT